MTSKRMMILSILVTASVAFIVVAARGLMWKSQVDESKPSIVAQAANRYDIAQVANGDGIVGQQASNHCILNSAQALSVIADTLPIGTTVNDSVVRLISRQNLDDLMGSHTNWNSPAVDASSGDPVWLVGIRTTPAIMTGDVEPSLESSGGSYHGAYFALSPIDGQRIAFHLMRDASAGFAELQQLVDENLAIACP